MKVKGNVSIGKLCRRVPVGSARLEFLNNVFIGNSLHIIHRKSSNLRFKSLIAIFLAASRKKMWYSCSETQGLMIGINEVIIGWFFF